MGDPGVSDGIINSVEDAAKAIRLHYKQGVDAIKIMPSGGVLDEGATRRESTTHLGGDQGVGNDRA
jgi:hypothetical protein